MRFALAVLIAIIYIVHSPIVHASENNTVFCSKLGELAGRSMAARLEGKPLTDLLKVKFNPAVREIFQTIIREAYARPLADGDNAWVRNMSDFRNDVEEKCQSSLNK
ncbi:hypothetical protein HBA92_12420 [Ochrobactrum sp. MR28]|nr:hypothetical protein [Ochrobactrum sp. MR28]MBX8816677.1 hypothetical protein [Ochrobactrum sp. MR31]